MPRVLIVGASTPLAGHLAGRLRDQDVRVVAPGDFAPGMADEVWCVTQEPQPPVVHAVAKSLAGVRTFVYVGPDGHPGLDREAVAGALAAGAAWRVVRVPPPSLHLLLTAIHSVRAEVEDRLPDHFRDHPLRPPVHGALPIARPEDVAEAAISSRGRFHTVPAPLVPVADLLPVIESCYGVTFADTAGPTDVDRLLALRLDGLTTVPPDGGNPMSAQELHELVDGIRKAQDDDLHAARDRATHPDRWLRTTSVTREVDPLTIATTGDDGPALVVVNALGQSTNVLSRLLDRLRTRHRVVTWRPLGVEEGDRPRDLDGQLADLADVIGHTGTDRVHLVGWCAGAKVATAFQRRHPRSVASLVFLNGTFKQDGLWPDLDIPYERNLDAVARAVSADPARAERLVGLFGGTAPTGDSPFDALSTALREEVRRPFRTAHALARYARQVRELWALDMASEAPHVDVDVLYIASERDTVSSPERALPAARLFPRARYAELALAGHYVPHDRPDLVAALITDFVRDPTAPPVHRSEVRWLSASQEQA